MEPRMQQLATVNSQLEHQLNNLREQLAEVVDEVNFCDGEIAKFKSQGDTLRENCRYIAQALSNTYSMNENCILALRNHISIVEDYLEDSEFEETKESRDVVEQSIAELEAFKRHQLRDMERQGNLLPAATAISRKNRPVFNLTQKNRPLHSRNLSRKSHQNDSLHEYEKQNQLLETRNEALQRQVADLEHQLHAMHQQGGNRLHDSKLSATDGELQADYDSFGMSSNVGVRVHRSGSIEIGDRDQKPKERSPTTSDEVFRLRQALEDQRLEFDRQQAAILKQTEREIGEAEEEIERLRQQLSSQQHGWAEESVAPSLRSSAVRVHRSGSVELQVPGRSGDGNFEESMRQSASRRLSQSAVSVEEASATSRRVRDLEESVARLRATNEGLIREVNNAKRDRDRAVDELERAVTHRGIADEEMQTERSQRTALRDALEKAQRDREAAMREQRAAERRHEGVMQEMRQLLEDRDRIARQREDAVRQCSEVERRLEQAEADLATMKREKAAVEELQGAIARERDEVAGRLQSEKRMHGSATQDLEVLKQQLDAVANERDMAIKEQELSTKRLDEILEDKRSALRARDEALKLCEEAEDRCIKAESSQQRAEKQFGDLRSQLELVEEQVAQVQTKARDWQRRCQEALTSKENAEDNERKAMQDLEAAQRQVRALELEMKNLIRVRDLALKQRDTALEDAEEFQSELAASRSSLGGSAMNINSSRLDFGRDDSSMYKSFNPAPALEQSELDDERHSQASENPRGHGHLMRNRVLNNNSGLLEAHQLLQDRNNKLIEEYQALQHDSDIARNEFKTAKEALQHELNTCNTRLKEANTRHKELIERYEGLQQEKQRLQSDLVTLKQSNQQLEQVADRQVHQTEDVAQRSKAKEESMELALQDLREEVVFGLENLSHCVKLTSKVLHDLELECEKVSDPAKALETTAFEDDRRSMTGSLVSLQDLNNLPHTPGSTASSFNRVSSPGRFKQLFNNNSGNAASVGVELREVARVLKSQSQDVETLVRAVSRNNREKDKDLSRCKTQCSRMKDEIRVMNEEITALNDQRKSLESKLQSFESKNNELTFENRSTREQLQVLENQLNRLKDDQDRLMEELKVAHHSKEQFCESERNARQLADSYRGEMKDLSASNEKLRHQLDDARELQQELEGILHDERQRVDGLGEEIRAREVNLQTQLSQKEEEMRSMKTTLRRQEQEIDELESKLKKQESDAESDRKSIERERDVAMQELQEVNRKYSSLREEVGKLETTISSLKHERDTIRDEVEDLRIKNVRLNPMTQELNKLRDELSRLQRKHGDTLASLEQVEDVRSRLSARTEELRQVELDRNSLERRNMQLEEKLERMASRVEELSRVSDKRIAVANTRTDDIVRQLTNEVQSTTLRLESAQSQELALRDENNRLVREIEEIQEAMRTTRDELLESRQQVMELEHAMERIRDGSMMMKKNQSMLANEVDTATKHLNVVASQKNHVTKELEEVYSSLADLQNQLSLTREENSRLRSSIGSQGRTGGVFRAQKFSSNTRDKDGQRRAWTSDEGRIGLSDLEPTGQRIGHDVRDSEDQTREANKDKYGTSYQARNNEDESRSVRNNLNGSDHGMRNNLNGSDHGMRNNLNGSDHGVRNSSNGSNHGTRNVEDGTRYVDTSMLGSSVSSPVSVHVDRTGGIVIRRVDGTNSNVVQDSVTSGWDDEDRSVGGASTKVGGRRYVYDLHGRRRLASDASINSYYR